MRLPRRQFLHLAAGAAALPAVSRFAWAQTYPSRPVTLVVACWSRRMMIFRQRQHIGATIKDGAQRATVCCGA